MNGAPFPIAGNGTTAGAGGAPSGSSVSAPGASGTGVFSPGNVTPFTGSADRIASRVSVVAVLVVAAAAAVLM